MGISQLAAVRRPVAAPQRQRHEMRADVERFEPARAVRAKSEAAVIGGIAENENRRPAANFAASQTVADQETADAAALSLGQYGDRRERQRGKWRDHF